MKTGDLRRARKLRPGSLSKISTAQRSFDTKLSRFVDSPVKAIIDADKRQTRSSRRATRSSKLVKDYHGDYKDALQMIEPKIKYKRREISETSFAESGLVVRDLMDDKFLKNSSLPRHRDNRCEKIERGKRINLTSEKTYLGPVECDVCHKIFKKKRYLRVHMKLHGSPRICEICGAILASEFSLEQHKRRHNCDYSIFCKICKKGFYHRANLNIHMTAHTNEKSIACEICKKPFANRVYLRSHMRTHLDPKMRKKFICEICNFETFYSYCYKEHRSIHTGEGRIGCVICGKYIRRQYMKIHTRMHNGEKNEICEFCGKAFVSRKYLTKHRRTHTGERPYVCFVCDGNFTQRSSLTKHLKLHDTEEIEDCPKF